VAVGERNREGNTHRMVGEEKGGLAQRRGSRSGGAVVGWGVTIGRRDAREMDAGARMGKSETLHANPTVERETID
jgi:hypothetical protein